MKLEKFIFTKDDGAEFVLSKTEAEKMYQELKSIFVQPSDFPVFIDRSRSYFIPQYQPMPIWCDTSAAGDTTSTVLPHGREL